MSATDWGRIAGLAMPVIWAVIVMHALAAASDRVLEEAQAVTTSRSWRAARQVAMEQQWRQLHREPEAGLRPDLDLRGAHSPEAPRPLCGGRTVADDRRRGGQVGAGGGREGGGEGQRESEGAVGAAGAADLHGKVSGTCEGMVGGSSTDGNSTLPCSPFPSPRAASYILRALPLVLSHVGCFLMGALISWAV